MQSPAFTGGKYKDFIKVPLFFPEMAYTLATLFVGASLVRK
jgi:hypothetical protein